ncbi:ROK family protein [Cohnella silvisoli]|uniref:ROK family protein n=1 Tax=Cohnella silvisoli TaxID=2873699 RepID=A0ABV1KT88_9BACL|nr:ROK family protein [Cohnella silvisoli]
MIAAIGIDIGGTNIKMGVVTREGELLLSGSTPTEADAGAEALVDKLLRIVEASVDRCANEGITLAGIGIGTAGQVNARTGEIAGATANLPGWAGIPLSPRLLEETGLPTMVDNDVNMIALGEAWLGAGKEWDDFLCVALGTGIGGCWISGGKIYHGRDGYAGEIGHIPVAMGGLPCTCGNRGCWEQYASVNALKRMAVERFNESNSAFSDPVVLFKAAKQGDQSAIELIDAYAENISVGLSGLIHVFNPPAIVIGGAISAQGEFLFERIRAMTSSKVMKVFHSPDPVRIVPAVLGDNAGVIGAARRCLIG